MLTCANIHQYQFNNPIIYNWGRATLFSLKSILYYSSLCIPNAPIGEFLLHVYTNLIANGKINFYWCLTDLHVHVLNFFFSYFFNTISSNWLLYLHFLMTSPWKSGKLWTVANMYKTSKTIFVCKIAHIVQRIMSFYLYFIV